jgi:hypothetical protein
MEDTQIGDLLRDIWYLIRNFLLGKRSMQTVKIESEYQGWIEGRVLQAFEGVGVKITEPARTMLAYVLQSQKEEGLVREDGELFQRADYLLARATEVYVEMYGSQTMTINRAIHVIVQTNQRYKVFPWGTSD